MPEPNFDLAQAHRWFAIECNNRAWDFIEKDALNLQEVKELLHLAHTSCWHWSRTGTAINAIRGQTLLVMACVKAKLADSAVWHTEQTLKLLSDDVEGLTAFDSAFVHGAASQAWECASNQPAAAEQHRLACEHSEQFTEPEDRELFQKLFPPIK